MSNEQDDLFDDQPAAKAEGESKTFEEPAKEQQPATKKDEDVDTKQVEDEKAGEETSETPSEEQKEVSSKTEKMIPESRFKAALNDITSKLENANAELSKLRAVPTPDKSQDPEGYERHVRMEVSREMMRSSFTDYDDVIKHYVEMAEANPYLNEQVAAHVLPAKFAYDLAKEDMRIKTLRELEGSDDWKEFQKFKQEKAAKKNDTADDSKVTQQLAEGGARKVPNLNRATNVSKSNSKLSEDDDLFADAAF